jgi:hypothetical protein
MGCFFITLIYGGPMENIYFKKRLIFFLILVLMLFICGLLVGPKGLAETIIFIALSFIPLLGGVYIIVRKYWERTKLVLFLVAGLFGFVSFELTLVGIVLNMQNKIRILSWGEIFRISGGIGIFVFLFSIFIGYFYGSIYSMYNKIIKKKE